MGYLVKMAAIPVFVLALTAAASQVGAADFIAPASAPVPLEISMDAAQKIALEKTGGGTVVKIERDYEDYGRIEIEIDIVKPDRHYEITLDGHTGAILEYEEKTPRHARR